MLKARSPLWSTCNASSDLTTANAPAGMSFSRCVSRDPIEPVWGMPKRKLEDDE
jgi:hypothetical protein